MQNGQEYNAVISRMWNNLVIHNPATGHNVIFPLDDKSRVAIRKVFTNKCNSRVRRPEKQNKYGQLEARVGRLEITMDCLRDILEHDGIETSAIEDLFENEE